MLKLLESNIDGLNFFDINKISDNRGFLSKIFYNYPFESKISKLKIKETYLSYSKKNVLRGMHLQKKPKDNYKIITCIKGLINDVCIDLRPKSKTFLNIFNLKVDSSKVIVIPPGVAHGFYCIKNSLVLYHSNILYYENYNQSIKWNSIKYNWDIKNPVISEKDLNAVSLNEYLKKL